MSNTIILGVNWNLEETVSNNKNFKMNDVIDKYVRNRGYSWEDKIYMRRNGIDKLNFVYD